LGKEKKNFQRQPERKLLSTFLGEKGKKKAPSEAVGHIKMHAVNVKWFLKKRSQISSTISLSYGTGGKGVGEGKW